MVPSIQKTAERKARYAAITDAFDFISTIAYCDRWLKAEDWLRIICAEYDLIVTDIEFTASDVYKALNKGKFRLATTSSPSCGVFRDEYKMDGRLYRYYFVQGRVARPDIAIERPGASRGNAVGISNPIAKECIIEKLEKDGLAKILDKNFVVEAVTSSTVKKTHSQISGGNENW
jgi:hypothetical protein